jgi:AcrR family transcriptional regulator
MSEDATSKVNVSGLDAIRAARVEWRLEQILGAATRLMATTTFDRMLVSDIAREAEVSVGTIYQYVSAKEDILLLIVSQIIEAYRGEVPAAMEKVEDPVERLAAGFRAYCHVVDNHRAAALLAYQESKSLTREGRERLMSLELETNSYFSDCIEEGMELGKFVRVDPGLVASDLSLLAHMWALKHWHLKTQFSFEAYVNHQLCFMVKALVVNQLQSSYLGLFKGDCTSQGERSSA